MAKNLTGDLHVISANRLADGAVVFLDDAGGWTIELARAALARTSRDSEFLLARVQSQGFGVVEPFVVAVREGNDGSLEPISLREKIRASGITFQVIAAEAVRYA
jgi:hypothetical protein